MNPRIKRLVGDWKTYAALISAVATVLAATPVFFKSLSESISVLKDLPPEARWIAIGIFGAAALLMLALAWSRKSRLLRPERFVLSSDQPAHLVGREKEIKSLASACERNRLVVLEGESGTGKSSIVRAGLLPHCLGDGNAQHGGTGRLFPLWIDASTLAWSDGLRIELGRAIRGFSSEERTKLGLPASLDSGTAFDWLDEVPEDAASQILVVLDQIDDYAVAHREHFVSENTVVSPEVLEGINDDWKQVARLVRDGRIRLLIVCRSDARGILDALRFCPTTNFLLSRIEGALIRPILDQVTSDDGQGPVVEDEEFGWRQVKECLLKDASTDGASILPVQLAIALDSLRLFKVLTPGEYHRAGGLPGLEREHIKRHLKNAAVAHQFDEEALLRGLMRLVTRDGQKTQRVKAVTFQKAIGLKVEDERRVRPLIDYLVRERILRQQKADDGEYLLLHHDYLARGVRGTHRQANHWEQMLRDRGRVFGNAYGWRQHWRALLPLSAQCHLLLARLRHRFQYGIHFRFALWSLTRWMPAVLAMVALAAGTWWTDALMQRQFAERMLAGIGTREMSEVEVTDWVRLASARDGSRFHAVQFAIENEKMSEVVRARADYFAHMAVGLDPDGTRSRQLLTMAVTPQLSLPGSGHALRSAATFIPYLRVTTSEVRIAAAIVERMQTETSHSGWSSALRSLAPKLEAKDALPLAGSLVERIKTETDRGLLSELREALGALALRLEAKDALPLAGSLVERMQTETDSKSLSDLGAALGSLSPKLEAEDVRPGAAALVKRMRTETDGDSLSNLGAALGSLSPKLEAEDVRPGAAALAGR